MQSFWSLSSWRNTANQWPGTGLHPKGTVMISCWARIAAGICWYSLLVVTSQGRTFFFSFCFPHVMTWDLHPVNRGHYSGTGSSASRRDASEASHQGGVGFARDWERSHPKSSVNQKSKVFMYIMYVVWNELQVKEWLCGWTLMQARLCCCFPMLSLSFAVVLLFLLRFLGQTLEPSAMVWTQQGNTV